MMKKNSKKLDKDWKSHTRHNIPEILKSIWPSNYNEITRPGCLWIELNMLFHDAIHSKNEDLIERILKEAIWYLELGKRPNKFSDAVSIELLDGILANEHTHMYIATYFPKGLFFEHKNNFLDGVNEEIFQQVLKMYNKKVMS